MTPSHEAVEIGYLSEADALRERSERGLVRGVKVNLPHSPTTIHLANHALADRLAPETYHAPRHAGAARCASLEKPLTVPRRATPKRPFVHS